MQLAISHEKEKKPVGLVHQVIGLAERMPPSLLQITPATETKDSFLIGPGGLLEGPYWRASGLCLIRHQENVSHGVGMDWRPDGITTFPHDRERHSNFRLQPLPFGGRAEFQSPVGGSRVAAEGLLEDLEVTERPSGYGSQIVTADKKKKLLRLIPGVDGIVESVSTSLPF